MSKKINKCPYCKGITGFEVCYVLGGYHTMHLSFNGTLIWEDRCGTDDIERMVMCLDCKKHIDNELVRIK